MSTSFLKFVSYIYVLKLRLTNTSIKAENDIKLK